MDVISGIYDACKTLFALIAAHPLMALATAVGALAAAYLLFRDNTSEAVKAEQRHGEELQKEYDKVMEVKEAWDELKESQQKQMDAGMTEMSYYEGLVDELNGLLDSNGKVKKGYEERASFIVDTLSEALDLEINKNQSLNGQIKDLTKNIDNVIAKKKAQIILNAQEELYAEAIKNETQASQELAKAEEQLNEEKQKVAQTNLEIEYAERNLDRAVKNGRSRDIKQISDELEDLKKLKDEQTSNMITADATYRQKQRIVQEYAYNKAQYEQNMVLAHKGAYDQMTTISWNYVKEYENVEDAEKKMAEDKLKGEQERLIALYQMRTESNAKILDEEIKHQEKMVEEAKKGLDKYNTETDKKLYYTNDIWDARMDALMSDLTRQNVRFYKTADGNVQMYVNGVKEGTPQTEEAMKELIANSVKELTNGTKYQEAGENIVDGVTKGVEIKKGAAYKAISSFGSNLLAKLKKALQEQSPSKATAEMGEFLDEGLSKGIKSEEKNVLKEANKLGTSLLGTLNNSLGKNLELNKVNIQAELNKPSTNGLGIKNNKVNEETMMVSAFKKALKEVKVVMNSREMGQFVTTTVEKEVFS